MQISGYIKKLKNNKLLIYVFVCSIIVALVSHGMMFFNKLSFHDDSMFFDGVGYTYSSGRWMLGILESVTKFLLGGRIASIPLINGLVSIVFISILLYLIIKKIDLSSKFTIFLVVGLVISFPCVTSTFGYMYTAPYYFFGALIGVIGAYIYYRKKNILSGIICATLMACSVGVYQANIPVCICTLLIFMLSEVSEKNLTIKEFVKEVFSNICICIGFIVEYFIINNIALAVSGEKLSDYKGINGFGSTGIIGYFERVFDAYSDFFCPPFGKTRNMFPGVAAYIQILIVLCTIMLILYYIRNIYQKNKVKALQIISIILVFPLGAFFVYVMVGKSEIHSVMTFGEVYVFILEVWLIEKLSKEKEIKERLVKLINVLLGILLAFFVRYSNLCYLKADVLKSQATSYFTSLITDIKSTEGYEHGIPVVYVNELKKDEVDIKGADYLFEKICILPYEVDSVINDYAWKEMMGTWCGFSPLVLDDYNEEYDEEIANMPCYPHNGSIKKIGHIMFVKFAE